MELYYEFLIQIEFGINIIWQVIFVLQIVFGFRGKINICFFFFYNCWKVYYDIYNVLLLYVFFYMREEKRKIVI